MDAPISQMSRLPERGEPRLGRCDVCGHRHACYVVDRPGQDVIDQTPSKPSHVCLGCLMRAADPAARATCAECVFPA